MIPWYAIVILFLLAGLLFSNLAFFLFIKGEKKRIDAAIDTIQDMISGDADIRLVCESEGALSRLFHEVNSLAAILRAHADDKTRNSEFLKSTIQDISHQLKTPLAALNIYNEILQDEDLDAESVKKFLNLSEQELDCMELLIQNLLKITKLDAKTILFHQKAESAKELLFCVGERFAVRAQKEEKTIQWDCQDISVYCDKEWTMEALGNLVKNSLEHTNKGNTIILRCRRVGDMACFQVEDDGMGIHEEDIYYIFKRFYRSRFSKDKSGIGLGLALVKSIVESQDGIVEVQSIFGKGSTFSIFLPIPTKL